MINALSALTTTSPVTDIAIASLAVSRDKRSFRKLFACVGEGQQRATRIL